MEPIAVPKHRKELTVWGIESCFLCFLALSLVSVETRVHSLCRCWRKIEMLSVPV